MSRINTRHGKCFGHSAAGGAVRDCARPPKYVTTQDGGTNPLWACSYHLTWLVQVRTAPGHSITVTRLEATDGT